jgi:hypothetical protein
LYILLMGQHDINVSMHSLCTIYFRVNITSISNIYQVLWWSFSLYFQLFETCSSLLLSSCIIPYNNKWKFLLLLNYKLVPIDQSFPIPPFSPLSPDSGNHHSIFNSYEINSVKLHVWVISWHTCHFVPGLFHLTYKVRYSVCCYKWQYFIILMDEQHSIV